MKNVKKLSDQCIVERPNWLAVLIDVTNGAHGAHSVVLILAEMVENDAMQPKTKFLQDTREIFTVQAALNVGNALVYEGYYRQAGLKIKSAMFLGREVKIVNSNCSSNGQILT